MQCFSLLDDIHAICVYCIIRLSGLEYCSTHIRIGINLNTIIHIVYINPTYKLFQVNQNEMLYFQIINVVILFL